MKLAVLLEGSNEDFGEIASLSNPGFTRLVDTEHCNEEDEIGILLKELSQFRESSEKVFIAKFSGREAVVREMGDEYDGMLICLSFNKNSRYHIDNIKSTFLNLYDQ